MKTKACLLFSIFIFSFNNLCSQNLVKNPSFEVSKTIQFLGKASGWEHGQQYSEDFNKLIPGWSSPSWLGNPSIHSASNPDEPFTLPQHGNIAVGLSLYAPAIDDHAFHAYDYVDFLMGTLEKPVKANETYFFEIWIKNQKVWANGKDRTICCQDKNSHEVLDTSHIHLCVASSNFGLLLIPDSLAFIKTYTKHASSRKALQTLQPHFNYCDLLEIDKGWCKIQGTFIAPFDAKHFVLGNFYTAEQTQSSVPDSKRMDHYISSRDKTIKDERQANYFIDNITIRPTDSLEFETYKYNNCLLRTQEESDSLSLALKVYQPSPLNPNPQRLCFLGNYDMAFQEQWSNCLGNFPKAETDSFLGLGYKPSNAQTYVLNKAKEVDLLCINEAHVHSEHRAFLFTLLDSLYKDDYRYLFLEALSDEVGLANINNPDNTPKVSWGAYLRDPVFAAVLKKARNLGMKVFPYDPSKQQIDEVYQLLLNEYPEAKEDDSGWYMEADGTQHSLALGELTFSARDRAMAINILNTLASLEKGKAIIYGGGGHMDINSCNYTFPLVFWLQKLTDQTLLSVNQTTLPEDYTIPYISDPSVLVKDSLVYFNTKFCPTNKENQTIQKNDISIIHPFYKRVDQSRPDWLSLGGARLKVQITVPKNIATPFVITIYEKGQNFKSVVPLDAVEYLEEIEEATLFIPALGCYDVFFISDSRIEKVEKCF